MYAGKKTKFKAVFHFYLFDAWKPLFVFDPHIKIIILKPWDTNKWHIIKSTNIHTSLESQPTWLTLMQMYSTV